jgi:hypothetical protein
VIRVGWKRLARRVLGARMRPKALPVVGPLADGFSAKHLIVTPEIPVLTHPPVVPAATLGLPASELVLGVSARGESRMYPTSTLRRHHIVNDRLADEPFVVCF